MNDTPLPSYQEILEKLSLCNSEAHALRQENKHLVEHSQNTQPAWVEAHQTISETLTDLMRVPKLLWNSRPRITITCGWFKD